MAASSEHWSGRTGFILANVAAAVGLGSIWKFPYEVGTNGGGSFIICYIVGLILIVFPLMLCELAIGRRGQTDAIKSVIIVADEANASRLWSFFALLGVLTGMLILSFYSVIGGWAIAYVIDIIQHGLSLPDSGSAKVRFDTLLSSPAKLLFYHLLFMAIAVAIVARGVSKGIERASMILMPTLIALIVLLAIYASAKGGFWPTWNYLFTFDISKITAKVALEALGLGFFSIGVGLSIMIAYAAYAGREIDLRQVATLTLVSDTVISLPIGGFGIAVFIGWTVPRSMLAKELRLGPTALATLYVLLRYVVPTGIAAASIAAFF